MSPKIVLLHNKKVLKVPGSSADKPALQLPFCWRRLAVTNLCSLGATPGPSLASCQNIWLWLMQAGKYVPLLPSPSLGLLSSVLFGTKWREGPLFSFALPTCLNCGTATLRKEELGHSFSKSRAIRFFIRNVVRSLFEVLRKIK